MIISKQSKIDGQYDVNLITKEDAGSFIYKVAYGKEIFKFRNDLFAALIEYNSCCTHQLNCAGV